MKVPVDAVFKMVEVTPHLRRNILTLERIVEKFLALTDGGLQYGELRFASARKVSRYLGLIMSKELGPYFWSSFNRRCNEISGSKYNKGIFGAKTEDTTVGPSKRLIRVLFYQPNTPEG